MTPPPHLPPLCQRIFDYVWRHFCCCHKRINQNFYLIPSIHDVALVIQSLNCVRLFYNSMDYSSPDSYVHGVSQARILEWVAISFSRGSSHPEIESASPALAGSRQILYRLSYQGSPPGLRSGWKLRKELRQTTLEKLQFSYQPSSTFEEPG